MITEQDTARETAALESLASLLDREKYLVSLIGNPGRRPCLCVSNRHHNALTEWIYCDGEWFWWSWAERVAVVADLDYAAKVITNVLRIVGDQP